MMLGGAVLWMATAWGESPRAAAAPAPDPTSVRSDIASLEQRLATVEARLLALEAEAVTHPLEPGGSDAPVSAGESLTLSGPVVVEAGQVVDEALGLNGPVDVYGHVRGNAVAIAADVRVHAGGRVDGDAVSLGGRVEVDDGGVVTGDRLGMGEQAAARVSPLDASIGLGGGPPADGAGHGIPRLDALAGPLRGVVRRVALIMGLMAAGVLVVGFWPRQVDRVVTMLGRRPIWYAVVGAVLMVVLGLAAGLLGLTIIGLPVGLLLLLAVAAGGILGFVGLGQAIGDRVPRAREHGGYAPFLVGAGLLAAVVLLPWVGPVVLGALALPAVGAGLVGPFRSAADD